MVTIVTSMIWYPYTHTPPSLTPWGKKKHELAVYKKETRDVSPRPTIKHNATVMVTGLVGLLLLLLSRPAALEDWWCEKVGKGKERDRFPDNWALSIMPPCPCPIVQGYFVSLYLCAFVPLYIPEVRMVPQMDILGRYLTHTHLLGGVPQV